MKRHLIVLFAIYIFLQLIAGSSCHHDPIIMEEVDPMDTIEEPIDTLVPCDPDVIYFQMDVLPLLKSNCALSGCHDATTAQDDIILDSYENVINSGKVTAFDLENSDLYEVLIDDDPEDRMPPEPNIPLTSEQISVISNWIMQGADNLECDSDTSECETENVSFSGFIFPVLQTNCIGCHSGGNPAGGISLISYDDIRPVAVSGLLSAVVNWGPGVAKMPQNSDKLDDCTLEKISSWIMDGALDN